MSVSDYFCSNPECQRHVLVECLRLAELDKDCNLVHLIRNCLFHFPSRKPEFAPVIPFCDTCRGAVEWVIRGFEA